MSSDRRPRAFAVALVVLAFASIGIASAVATGKHARGPFAHGGYRGLSAKRVLAGSHGVSSRVIVVLRNQLSTLPASKRHVKARIAAEAGANASIESDVQRAGGHIYRRYHALNAFAATVSKTERADLARSRQVASVIPDTVVKLPGLDNSPANPNAAAGPTNNAQQICPTDPSKPLLEPEALQTTHTAFTDPSTPQAQNLATGAGVKVAFFADGLDINNPDFIRPDGSHVFIDYKDFSGDGLSAPSNSLEAFGDASSIAAQGRQTYDISQFVNPAHPLPPGCNITVRGVAPGASLIGMKVFGNADSAFNSVILQGLDYALANDHPDVISESFGGYPIPDSTQDLTRLFNEQAVAAGVTVVESSGDSGVEASPSSASSDPSVISAGASTTFRNYAQGTQYGFQFSNGGWLSDNISSIESAGFTQGGRTLDLIAPGEANWALCTANTALYQGCTNFAGQPTNLESFGGTSESAPLIAGGAALVIQAYRQAHGGVSPSPSQVRQLLTSTATDLDAPSDEQGAGELDTLAAVQAAESINGGSHPSGQNQLVSPTQLDLSDQAGSQFSQAVKVTNAGSSQEFFSAHVRQLSKQLSNQTGSVTLSSASPTFVDQFGDTVPYQKIQFHVPAGADRLVTFLSWNDATSRVGLTLIDPTGKFAAYTRPQGDGNHGEVDVQKPVGGTWTGLIFRRDGTFTGPVQWQATSQQFGNADGVSPLSIKLNPGQTGTFHVAGNFPGSAGDSNQDLVVSSSSGGRSIVPIALRSLIPIGAGGGNFSGTLIGGNGRNGFFQPAQIDTYDFEVPRGQPELSASLSFPKSPGTEVFASLVNPEGQTVTGADNAFFDAGGNKQFGSGLEAYATSPEPGRWRLVVDVINPLGGQNLAEPYSGRIGFSPPPVHVTGLPNSASAKLPAGQPATVTVRLNNNGAGADEAYLDPRSTKTADMSLLSLTPDTNIAFPIPAGTNPPLYLVPTETTQLGALAEATEPVTFDFGYGDPDIAAISSGNSAAGSFKGAATPGVWSLAPDPVGPFTGPAPTGKVSTGMVAHTLGFDPNASSSTGDIEAELVDPNAAGFSPLLLTPGQTGTMTLTITPSGKPGKTVKGTLFVNSFDEETDLSSELVALPYEYTIG
jgi:uncharacterized protein YfaP (DUF2135 family)